MSNRQVGFGVVGLGTWGENHLKTLADEPGVGTGHMGRESFEDPRG